MSAACLKLPGYTGWPRIEGDLSRRVTSLPEPQGTFDVKHLPKLCTEDGQLRKRFLYFAVDRCSRFIFLAVYNAENAANAVDILAQARKAFFFRITRILTDRGSCFNADDFGNACAELKASRRKNNWMVERFNGRIASGVLDINVAGTC
jgi:transposase InsO family protein